MKNIHYIPHTHWDREWYRSSDGFRIRVTYTFDMLLDILDRNSEYKYFTFDGQTSALEDYLQIRPQNKEKIKKYVKEKRILIGPWFTQPDLFLASGESILRNLLIGSNIADNMGHCMESGWIPDAFGQIQNTPQIFKELGMKSLFVWRGFNYESTKDSVFLWEAPNGDSILTIHFPLGYGNYRYLPEDYNKAFEEVKEIIDKTENRFVDNEILFMGGSDHARAQEESVDILNNINEKLNIKGYNIKISNPEEYTKEVKEKIAISNRKLEVYKGDARSAALGRIHAGISSTRIDIKNDMKKYEMMLPLIAEPMSVINSFFGGRCDQQVSNYFWKILFKNQFHDSAYSSSPETVNQTVENRLLNLRHGINELIWLNIRYLQDRVDFSTLKENEEPIVIFNTLPHTRNDLVFINLIIKEKEFTIKDKDNNLVPFILVKDVQEVSSEVEYYNGVVNFHDSAEVKEGTKYRIQIKIKASDMPIMGYKVLKICYGTAERLEPQGDVTKINDKEFQNTYIKVKINENGTLDITNKLNNLTYSEVHWFEDKGDDGDEYNYSPPEKEIIVTTKNLKPEIKIIENSEVEIKYRITYNLVTPAECIEHNRTLEEVTSQIITEVSLKDKQKRVDFKTTIDNKAKDHMIRAIFKDIESSVENISQDHFGTIVRNNKIITQRGLDNGATEIELPIYPMQKWVKINDTKDTFAVISAGACEYEIYNNNEIALTILRSVGKFGKADLVIRPGRSSGYRLDTPTSQLLKKVSSQYSIYINKGELNVQDLSKEVKTINVPVQSRHINTMKRGRNKNMPWEYSLLKLDDKLELMALKKSESGNGYIIRLQNQSKEKIDDGILEITQKPSKVYLSNLKEEKIEEILVKDNIIFIPTVKAESFITIYMEIK